MQRKLSYALLCAFFFLSCIHHSTESHQHAVLYQVSGCHNNVPSKSAFEDSCFSYHFQDPLTIDFCVRSNCCPDSQRFRLDYDIRRDTIVVTVTDTAAHLCRCICPYLIHAEFFDLPLDSYVFYCHYSDEIVYKEVVRKSF